MSAQTHTTAGRTASAGAPRLSVGAGDFDATVSTATAMYAGAVVHAMAGGNHAISWTKGALAKPSTCVVFDSKNRPTRPLSELSL